MTPSDLDAALADARAGARLGDAAAGPHRVYVNDRR